MPIEFLVKIGKMLCANCGTEVFHYNDDLEWVDGHCDNPHPYMSDPLCAECLHWLKLIMGGG